MLPHVSLTAQQFELILDDAPTGGQGRGNNANNKKKEARDTKAKYEAKVMESRKQERATYERKLQVSQATASVGPVVSQASRDEFVHLIRRPST
jgi:hypothetical protein